ncbi:hypothetical protein ACH3VR_19710 [Microbacterium sp. B2969]|uniref:Uncharacterized protein n=1 Tax=Microbacterium alkaliflavum TaxID=3248839 RepID=A0ABW7QE05_9MICO
MRADELYTAQFDTVDSTGRRVTVHTEGVQYGPERVVDDRLWHDGREYVRDAIDGDVIIYLAYI